MAKLYERESDEKADWVSAIPFIIVHLMPLVAIFTGVTWQAVVLLLVLFWGRMFFITAGFHRYFAHRGYELGRFMQFVMAFGATTSAQKGPLWWSGYHRHHHRFSDTPKDIHSPLKGFWWSHVGWILAKKYKAPRFDLIKDFAKFPELRWLDQHHLTPSIILGMVSFMIAGLPGLFFGFFGSTVLLYHSTFFINSLAHIYGRRRYITTDTSRNSYFLAFLTMGEGWHNNHHYYRSSANQGFFWWEIDFTYYILKAMSWVGLVKNLRKPPKQLLNVNRVRDTAFDVGIVQNQLQKAQTVLAKAKFRYEYKRVKMSQKYEKKKARVEELVQQTRQAAEEVARQSKGAIRQ